MRRYEINRIGKVGGGLLIVFFFLPMVVWGVLMNVQSETVRCTRAASDVTCSTDSNGPFGGSRSVLARDVERSELRITSKKGAQNLVLVTPAGDVRVPAWLLSMQTPGMRRELAAELDAWLRKGEAAPLEWSLRPAIPFRVMFGALALLGLFLGFVVCLNIELLVDSSRNLHIRRRVWRFVLRSTETPLDTVTRIAMGERRRKYVELVLQRQGGEPVSLGFVNLFMLRHMSRVQTWLEAAQKSDV